MMVYAHLWQIFSVERAYQRERRWSGSTVNVLPLSKRIKDIRKNEIKRLLSMDMSGIEPDPSRRHREVNDAKRA